MPKYEYKVIPAPKRGVKAKGLKDTESRFANALQSIMNDCGAEGWDYVRTDTLPCEERVGLTGRTTTFQNMLVFRRTLENAVEAVEPPAQDQTLLITAEPEPEPAEVTAPNDATPETTEPRVAAE